MPRALHIIGEYPPEWPAISAATWAAAGHRCIRCLHPYVRGEHGKGEWTACGHYVFAQWRIGTTHHLDGNKANCVWWNLLALCQRCHLTIQSRVDPQQPYMLEHSDWFKPYVAGFYAKKYEGRDLTREEAVADMARLLTYERIA